MFTSSLWNYINHIFHEILLFSVRMNSNQTLSLRVPYKSCITRALQRKRTDKCVVLSLKQHNKHTQSSSIFQGWKKKTRKKRRKKEIYQNVRYKSKLRLVTRVFDVASNGNGIPSIHTSPVEERKERTSQHPFQRIRRYEECRFANFNGAMVSWLDLSHWIISISIVTGVETPL